MKVGIDILSNCLRIRRMLGSDILIANLTKGKGLEMERQGGRETNDVFINSIFK